MPKILKVIPDGNLITEIAACKINLTLPWTDQPVEDHGKYLTIRAEQPDGVLVIPISFWRD